ncbi:MAG TPA: hypothetical protein DEP84_12975 [Chloroflexi bacterium]|nr:hypothetical protein [Chloroflexota bacterium]
MKVLFVSQAVLDDPHVEYFGGPSQPDQVLAEADSLALHGPLTGKPRRGGAPGPWLRMVRDAHGSTTPL